MTGRERSTQRRRTIALAGLHLAVLWSFACAQPLLDLLGSAPEFFVARENTRGDILLLAFALMLLPPLLLATLEAVLSLVSERLRLWLHLCLVAVFAAVFALQLLKSAPGGSSAWMLVAGAGMGLLAGVAYARTRLVPTLLTVLSPAPLVFLLVFLALSPVSKLVLPGDEAQAASVAVPGEPPIVMIVFDELAGYALMGPDGRIEASRYPNFARLAGDSTWYRNASTVADFTERAVPALLSGEPADRRAAPIASNHPESLFTLLGGRYTLDVTEPMTDVCPRQLCPAESSERPPAGTRLRELASDLGLVSLHLLLPDELTNGLVPVDRSFGDFTETDQVLETAASDPAAARGRELAAFFALVDRAKQFTDFERRLSRAPRAAHLAFLHLQLPHNPYHLLPTGQRYPDPLEELPGLENDGSSPGGRWADDRWSARQAFQRYLLQTAYADRLLGRVLDRLRARGVYDRALVVVMADHGAAFSPGQPHRAATRENLPQIASIPLLLKAPGQRQGRIDDSNVQTIDLLPTMAARLGVRLPWDTVGRSADRARVGGRITLQPHSGDDLSLPFSEYVRRRNGVVRRMAAEFGRTSSDIFRGGLDSDLVGAAVGTLAKGSPGPGRFELDGGGMIAAVDPHAALVPSLLTGRVEELPAGARMAVAINGRVAAVTVPFDDGDLQRFSALVRPAAFARGANSVGALAVTGTGAARHFERLEGVGLTYRIARFRGREALVDQSGRRIPVYPSEAAGAIEKLTLNQPELSIEGWAGDLERGRAAGRVIAFAGDRFLAAGPPVLRREDLKRRFGGGLAKAGFRLSGWAGRANAGSARADVRVFAVVEDRAGELPHD